MQNVLTFFLFCLLINHAQAQDWYSNYRKALKSINQGAWVDASHFLSEAVLEKSRSEAKARPYGTIFIDYLPYFYLGRVAEKSNDFISALDYLAVEEKFHQIEKSFEHSRYLKDIQGIREVAYRKLFFSFIAYMKKSDYTEAMHIIEVLANHFPEKEVIKTAKAIIEKRVKTRDVEGISSSHPPSLETTPQNYALLFAVQDYNDKNVAGLQYPKEDAWNLALVLYKHYGYDKRHIYLVTDPDRLTMIDSLMSLKKRLSAADNLLIFFAGHGCFEDDEGYWWPRDAAQEKPGTWFPNYAIIQIIKQMKCRHILVVADACFSGTLTMRTPDPAAQKTIKELRKRPSRHALTSGGKERVPDVSVFITYLVQALDKNTNKFLTCQQLYSRLIEPVVYNSPVSQIPQYAPLHGTGHEGGDYIFERTP
ncbi:MAG TPA: caspase family protein [bacterium]|nr:caspase family protein [bacterium]HQJ65391.1 caspase family protein [bacterium]